MVVVASSSQLQLQVLVEDCINWFPLSILVVVERCCCGRPSTLKAVGNSLWNMWAPSRPRFLHGKLRTKASPIYLERSLPGTTPVASVYQVVEWGTDDGKKALSG